MQVTINNTNNSNSNNTTTTTTTTANTTNTTNTTNTNNNTAAATTTTSSTGLPYVDACMKYVGWQFMIDAWVSPRTKVSLESERAGMLASGLAGRQADSGRVRR